MNCQTAGAYLETGLKTSRATVEQNRERLLQLASEGFRRHGFEGVKVADIMKGAGLTHGGFYNYFESKDDLAVQACDLQLKHQSERLRALSGEGRIRLSGYFERYLTAKSRDHPEQACLFPSLAGDIARQGEAVREAFTSGVEDYIAAMQEVDADLTRADALTILSTLVGAMALARAVNDKQVSDAILTSARESLVARYVR